MKVTTQINQQYVMRGGRLFVVPRALSLTDRRAARGNVTSSWDRVNQARKDSRVIRNAK